MSSIKCRYNGTSTKICVLHSNIVKNLKYYLTDIKVNGTSIGVVEEYPVTSTDTVEFMIKGSFTPEMLFYGCDSLVSMEISDGIVWISKQMCEGCVSLQSVLFGNDVQDIGVSAFYGCTSLTSIVLPEYVRNIDSLAFYNCSSLSEMTIKSPYCTYTTYKNSYDNGIVTPFGNVNNSGGRIASGGTLYYQTGAYYSHWLNDDAILGVLGWNGVGIDCGVEPTTPLVVKCKYNGTSTKICSFGVWDDYPEDSIRARSSFLDIKVNGTSIGVVEEYPVTSTDTVEFVLKYKGIPPEIFYDCTSLTSVVIPNGITHIWGSSFNGCKSLIDVTIPNSVTVIGESAFDSCTSLTSVVIPDSVWLLQSTAFMDCSNLQNVNLGNSLTEIIDTAFYNCTSLTSVVIPDSVWRLEASAFGNCPNLSAITLGTKMEYLGYEIFERCTNLKTIYVKSEVPAKVYPTTFYRIASGGTLNYPTGADFSQWLSTDEYYLGYYGWNGIVMNPEDMPDNPEGGGGTDPDNPEGGGGTDPDNPEGGGGTDPDNPEGGGGGTDPDNPEGGGDNDDDDDNDDNDDDNPRPDRVQMSGDVDFIKCDYEYLEFDYTGEPSIWITITWVGNYTGKRTGVSHSWIKIGEPVVVDNTIYRYPVYLEQSNSNTERSGSISFAADKIDGSGSIAASLRVYQTSAPDAEIHPFKTSMKVDANGKPDYASDTAIRCGYTALAVVTPVVDGDWIHLGKGTELNTVSTYDTVMEYPISFDANTGEERTGTITFMGLKDNGTALSEVCVITQAKNPNSGGNQGGGDEGGDGDDDILPELPEDSTDETFSPIWKDVEYVFGGSDVTYGIYQEQTYRVGTQWVTGDVLIYKGRAYAAPNESAVKVNINKVCQNFMSEPPSIFNGAVGFGHSFNTFKLKGEYGNVLHTYHFINDWSYKELTLGLKTNPIVPYIGDGQQLFFSALAQSQKAIQWGMRYYDGTSAYNNTEYISNAFKTNVVANSRRKNVRTFYFGNKYFEVLPLCSCKYVLYYLNPYGGYDWFPITGRVLRRDKLEAYTVTQNYNNTTSDFGKKRYLSTINITYQINTQWLTQEQSDRMWELLESNQVWIHSLEDDKVHPVIITDTDVEHKQKTNSNRMISYQINLEHSQTRERV